MSQQENWTVDSRFSGGARDGGQLDTLEVEDFYDQDEVKRIYYPEVEQLLKEATGAEKVVLADSGSGVQGFPDWAEQLIAESTGKNGTGLLPVAVENTGAPGLAAVIGCLE